MFLVNSRPSLFTATLSRFMSKSLHATGVPLIPKLRGYFAEFLNEGAPARLRIFSSTTCVGLRYGHLKISLEVFLGHLSNQFGERVPSTSLLGLNKGRICLSLDLRACTSTTVRWLTFLAASPHRTNVLKMVPEY